MDVVLVIATLAPPLASANGVRAAGRNESPDHAAAEESYEDDR